MNKQHAEFAIKLIGICTLVYSIPYLRLVIDAFAQKKLNFFEDETQNVAIFKYALFSSSTILVLLLSCGICLILFAQKTASRLLHEKHEQAENSKVPIQSVGFSIIGIYLLFSSIPEIVEPIAYYFLLENAGDSMPAFGVSLSSWASLIANALKAIIGILLFLGANGLCSAWYFFQRARPMSKTNMNK